MKKLLQKEKKANRKIRCECCKQDKKRNLSYYRNGKYFINKNHYKKYLKKEKDKK